VPPLRERSGDVSLLAEHLLTRIARERGTAPRGLSEAARELLARHRWPGNVRELENVLRSVSLFCDGETIDAADFADYRELGGDVQLPVEEAPAASAIDAAYDELRNRGIGLRELKKRVEGECIRQALAETEGNITRAAELLQMKRPRLSQLVREHGIR